MGDELGDWSGRFRVLNLGIIVTLIFRRGMFCGKRSDEDYRYEGESIYSLERFRKCLLVFNVVVLFIGCFGFEVVRVIKVNINFVSGE